MEANITKKSFFVFGLLVISILNRGNIVNASEPEEFIFLRQEGTRSPFRFNELLLQNDGSGKVTYNNNDEVKWEYSFNLDEYELEALRTFIYAFDFFNQPEEKEDRRFLNDVGTTTLRVSLEGKKHELTFRLRFELDPLTSTLNKLINQGIILNDLENKGNVRSAKETILDSYAAPKILQQEILREPLIQFASKTNKRQELLDAFDALSGLMTQEEWIGLLSKEVNNSSEDRKILLLEAISSSEFTISMPNSQRDMLCHMFLRYFRLEYKNWAQFSKEKKDAYNSIIRLMGMARYTEAIPVFMELLIEEIDGKIKPIIWMHNALTQMGESVIQPLKPLLNSTNSDARATAVNLLGDILASNPDWPKKNSIPENEQERILTILRTDFRSKIQELAENDTSSRVRNLAKSALKQIDEGWRNK